MTTVVTTIQHPTDAMRQLSDLSLQVNEMVVVVGDAKSPPRYELEHAVFLSLEDQSALAYETAATAPLHSYSRKNIGYLHAMANGAKIIRETDDDNFVTTNFFRQIPDVMTVRVPNERLFVNPYAFFGAPACWPRGYPLEELSTKQDTHTETHQVNAGAVVSQGLANGEPDVDAVFRLTQGGRNITFAEYGQLRIPKGNFAPFNSQATLWQKPLWPLLYLPSTCSFRMTDIWRGFIAQRILHAIGGLLVFTAPTATQERNPHNLLKDFEAEIEGYVGYAKFIAVIQATPVEDADSIQQMLLMIYQDLVTASFFREDEMASIRAWNNDVITLSAELR